MSDPVSLNAELELEIGASARLDLSEAWVAYLDETEVPSSVDGVDNSVSYADDDTANA